MSRISFQPLVSLGLALGAITFLSPGIRAATVGASGYANDFTSQPLAVDFSTGSLGGGAGDIVSTTTLDTLVQGVLANNLTAQPAADPANPPPILATATWSETGMFLQTRATGNGATLLLCSLINSLGANASAVTVSYDFAKIAPAAEDIEGHRAYYSLTGAAGSWTLIPEFSSANPGRVTAVINVTLVHGGTLYLLWADDNGAPSPDTALQMDNFSVALTPAAQTPASITAQPQSLTVGELNPASFSVTVPAIRPRPSSGIPTMWPFRERPVRRMPSRPRR